MTMASQNVIRKQLYQGTPKRPLENPKFKAAPISSYDNEKQKHAKLQTTSTRKVLLPSRKTHNSVTNTSDPIAPSVIVISDDDESQKRSVKRRHQSEVTPGFDLESSSKRLRGNSNGPSTARALRYHSTNSYDKYLPERPLYTLETVSILIIIIIIHHHHSLDVVIPWVSLGVGTGQIDRL